MENVDQYKRRFGLDDPPDKEKAKRALEYALDVRKFEIELYWKRAGYFWALIAGAAAGFFAVLAAEDLTDREYYAYVVGIIGFIFTWAWFLVNRGSKFWQENWENHVDMLEDSVTGPLFKTILRRPKGQRFFDRFITGPADISVSKVNQWVSLFTLVFWLFLIFHVLPRFDFSARISWERLLIAVLAFSACILMWYGGKTHLGPDPHSQEMITRRTDIL